MASRWPSLARTLGGRDSLRVLMMRTLLVRRTRLRRRSCLRPALDSSASGPTFRAFFTMARTVSLPSGESSTSRTRILRLSV